MVSGVFEGKIIWKMTRRETKIAGGSELSSSPLLGVILESVTRRLFTMNEHTIANVYFYLSFQLRILFVKNIYFYKLDFTLKYYWLM